MSSSRGIVDGKDVIFSFDTDSNVTLMPNACFKRLFEDQEPGNQCDFNWKKLKAANGLAISYVGYVNPKRSSKSTAADCRPSLSLTHYHFDIKYQPGQENVNARMQLQVVIWYLQSTGEGTLVGSHER